MVQQAHQTGYNNITEETQYNYIIDKYIYAVPATGRKARDIKAQNEISNQAIIEIDYIANTNRL